MKLKIVGAICAAWIAVNGLTAGSQQKAATLPFSRFEQFKSLDGEWTGPALGENAKGEMKVLYHVTSGGSAVTETIDPKSDHEMITVFTRDKGNIALTHYCAMGNQPHMVAQDAGTGKIVVFKFQSGGNMTSEMDTHMHNVTYTFVDNDHLKADWTLFSNGKQTGTFKFVLARKK